jgi:hypothetical protein
VVRQGDEGTTLAAGGQRAGQNQRKNSAKTAWQRWSGARKKGSTRGRKRDRAMPHAIGGVNFSDIATRFWVF